MECPVYLSFGSYIQCQLSLITNGENALVNVNYNNQQTESMLNKDSNQSLVFTPTLTGIFNLSVTISNVSLYLYRLINGKIVSIIKIYYLNIYNNY